MREAFLKILKYFPSYWREEFKWGYYLSVLAMLGIFAGLNYYLLPDVTIERWITRRYYGEFECMWWYLGFYGIPYYLTVVLYSVFHNRWDILRNRQFWLRSLFGLLVISMDASFSWYQHLLQDIDGYANRYVWFKYIGNFYSTITIGGAFWLYWYVRDRKYIDSFYGLTRRGFDWRPYAVLMALMVPLVVTAAFTSGFLNYYPTLKLQYAERFDLLPTWATMAIYEFVYAFDFIWTEVAFRGFFVIAMAKVMGGAAIVPMCSIYEFRHFAKPLGEAISSIFGGYILGVIALKSRNILGGVWIHMGIALLMELVSILIKGF